MKVVVFGATGNVGSATMRALAAEPAVTSIVGVARRRPEARLDTLGMLDKVSWQAADIVDDPFEMIEGADVVVHLAWKMQPQHDHAVMAATNIVGTRRVLEASARWGVPGVVCASSVGAYGPGPKRPVDESWPTTGIRTCTYSRQKAAVEAMLDEHERCYPQQRVVRMRTSLVFQRSAASEIHRLFLGRLVPWHLPSWARVVPSPASLTFQATHADDIADAYRRAVVGEQRGAFNVAAGPVLTPQRIADAVGGRTVTLPVGLLRAAAGTTFALRLQPTEAGWIDMATRTPLMSTARAETELGWTPRHSSTDALVELFDGIGDGAGGPTPPLMPRHPRNRWHWRPRRAWPNRPTERAGQPPRHQSTPERI